MHIMVDLETMGNRPNAPIVAIGAVFMSNGVVYEKHGFYATVSLRSAVSEGGVLDPETVMWWLRQSKTAQDALEDTQDVSGQIRAVLDRFESWMYHSVAHIADDDMLDGINGIWGNGAAFDNVILRETYARLDRRFPIPFWLDKCYRTVKGAYPQVGLVRTGEHHNALDDAITQANHLVDINEVAGGVFL